jgi:hypothetical protein
MASLLGLPILSALALPFMSSSTTSINLVFFYMTWLTLTLSHPPLKVELYLLCAIRFVFYLLPSTLSLLFDTAVPSLAARTKALEDRALAGRLGGKRLARVVALSTANVLGGVFLFVGVEWLLTEGLVHVFHVHFRSGLMVSKRLPAPWTVILSVIKLTAIKGVSLEFSILATAAGIPRRVRLQSLALNTSTCISLVQFYLIQCSIKSKSNSNSKSKRKP